MANGEDDKENGDSLWALAFKQATNPWDWAFLVAGGAVGSIGTVASHFADLGHSIPATALASVALRRAGVASMRRRSLRRKALQLRESLSNRSDIAGMEIIQYKLDNYLNDFDSKLSTPDEFEKQIRELIEEKNNLILKKLKNPFV
jgi:hypothetical protein